MLILSLVQKSLASVAYAVTGAARLGFSGSRSLWRAMLHRREVLRMSELDERALKDIGLVRSDIDGALAEPWFKDPSAALAARSNARAGVASTRREQAVRQAVNTELEAGASDKASAVCCG